MYQGLGRITLTDADAQLAISVRAIDIGEVRQTARGTIVQLPSGALRAKESQADIHAMLVALWDEAVKTSHWLRVYAAGAAYTLTTSYALADFGTTDPKLTIDRPGTYLVLARLVWMTTSAASPTVDFKLRRTNNTAADLANSETSISEGLSAISGATAEYEISLPPVVYTTENTDDLIELWGKTSAGSPTVTEASIVAVRIV